MRVQVGLHTEVREEEAVGAGAWRHEAPQVAGEVVVLEEEEAGALEVVVLEVAGEAGAALAGMYSSPVLQPACLLLRI